MRIRNTRIDVQSEADRNQQKLHKEKKEKKKKEFELPDAKKNLSIPLLLYFFHVKFGGCLANNFTKKDKLIE